MCFVSSSLLQFRKPLIAFTPKSLLRHPQCKSNIKDFAEGTKFENIIDDPYKEIAKGKNVKRLAFCSGKVYYDLVKERSIRKQNDIRFIRMEQIAPFPYDLVSVYSGILHPHSSSSSFWNSNTRFTKHVLVQMVDAHNSPAVP